jgi:Na+/phosphate symporter
MITIYLAPLIALAGVLIYALAANPKAVEIGRIMFACGLLVALLEFASGRVFHF